MLAFTIHRIGQAILVMLTVSFISFGLFNYIGDPVNNMAGQDATAEQRTVIGQRLGLDDPFPIQFARFVGKALHCDFGISYRLGLPVRVLLAERLPATIELVGAATLIAVAVGIPLGIYSAVFRQSLGSRLLLSLTVIGISLPTFLVGVLMIMTFSVWLRWLPSLGRGDVVDLGVWSTGLLTASGRKALVLPSLTLASFQLALIARLVRTGMVDVLQTDYIRFARARGLSHRTILFGHALRNTLVPVITNIGLQIGSLIAFAIVTETVFQWPGLGLLFLQAIQFADIPVMAAYLVLVALTFGVLNLLVDVLHGALDPRIRATSMKRIRG